MTDELYCFLAFVLSLGVITLMFVLVFGARRGPLFKDAADIFARSEEMNTLWKRVLFVILLAYYLRGPAFFAALLPFFVVLAHMVGAVCGFDVEIFKEVRGMLNDILDFFRERQGPPTSAG